MADSLGADRFHLVGHDYGAVVAWQVAARHQEHLLLDDLVVGAAPRRLPARPTRRATRPQRSGYFAWFRDPATDAELGDPARLRQLYLAAGLSDAEADVYCAALGSPAAHRQRAQLVPRGRAPT